MLLKPFVLQNSVSVMDDWTFYLEAVKLFINETMSCEYICKAYVIASLMYCFITNLPMILAVSLFLTLHVLLSIIGYQRLVCLLYLGICF